MGTVLLSGASGFIAQNAAERFKKCGFRTIGISQSSKKLAHFDVIYTGALTEPLKGVFGEGIDIFFHCAHHTGKDDYSVNVEGTRMWAEQAEMEGVAHQIFLSSVSARADSASSYSRAKHVLEQWFISHEQVVLRMGLVLGKGGLYQRMANLVDKYPVLPILDGGRLHIFVSGIHDICKALTLVVEQEHWTSGKTWNLFQSESFYLREILEEIKKQLKTTCFFFPFPSGLAFALIKMLEKVPFLKFGISSNNIIGLKQNVILDWASDYEQLGLSESSLEHLVAKAC